MLSTGFQRQIVRRQNRITKSGAGRSKPNGAAQIRRTAFGYLLSCAEKFSGLVDFHVQSGERNKLARRVEAVDIADFAEDDSTKRIANAGSVSPMPGMVVMYESV